MVEARTAHSEAHAQQGLEVVAPSGNLINQKHVIENELNESREL